MCWLSVPALDSGLLQSGVAAALILSPLGLCPSGPAIALFELFIHFFALELSTGTAMILLQSPESSSRLFFFWPVFAQ